MLSPDWQLSSWITSIAGNLDALDAFMKVVASNYFAPRVAAILALCLWFGTRDTLQRERNQKTIIAIGAGIVLSFGVAESLCLIQDHIGDFWPRPYDSHPNAQEAMELLAFRLPDSSFPSNAMCGLAPIATGLWFADRRASIALWIVVLLWGFGRVYVGIHFPLDVAAGIAIGIGCALIARKMMRTFDPLVSFLLAGAKRLYLA